MIDQRPHLISIHFSHILPHLHIYLLILLPPLCFTHTLRRPESFFNKVIDPLYIERLRSLSSLWIVVLLPWIIIDHQKQYIRKRIDVQILSAGDLLLFLGLFEVLLVELGHVGVLLLGLEVAAVT